MKSRALPSPAQVRHRHNFAVHGAIASMEGRLRKLIADKLIPPIGSTHGTVKLCLIDAIEAIIKARKLIEKGALRD